MTAEAANVTGPHYELDVSLVCDSTGRTHIGAQYVAYPFHLCRALRTLGDPVDMPTLYIQSCSGGLFEGDDLNCRLRVGARARAHVTTAASTVVHSMQSGGAVQQVEIDMAAESFFEYLPDPIILFPDASLRNVVDVRLAPGAVALVWDTFLSHDPKANGGVFRELTSELNVSDDNGRLLARDRYRAQGEALRQPVPGVMGAARTQAGFALLKRDAPTEAWVAGLREALTESGDAYVGVSALPNNAGAWVRVLAADTAVSRELLGRAWSRARLMTTGVVPVARRK